MNVNKRIISLILAIFLVLIGLIPGSGQALAQSAAEVGGEGEAAGYVALTFDDGPSGSITRRLLEGLREREARATFFLCGYRLEQYPEVAALIVEQGHELGLHGYSHKSMRNMDKATLNEELEKNRTLVLGQTGQRPTLLRPPGGCCSRTVEEVAREQGLVIVTWSVDPKDWADHNADVLTRRIVSEVKDGDVILMHDMWRSSVDAALTAVEQLQAEGFVFVTVSELAALKGQELEAGRVYDCLG